ncbi:hypothetical protein M9Y10_016716 [Tritrichomonas musculus]|uniref:Uncharacterized protein n=1 Tax=Tritrichomonas musculus TaxID=1915356 RepID=A0ABR2HXZ8_9EUKA
MNNEAALQYLCQHDEQINKIHPNYETDKDKNNLLALIITKKLFTIDHENIIIKCNIIFKTFNFQIENKKDFFKYSNLLYLLKFFREDLVEVIDEDHIEFGNNFQPIFEKAQVPIVVDANSIKPENQYQFFIQVEIIFDIFNGDSILTNVANSKNKERNNTDNDQEIEKKSININDEEQNTNAQKKEEKNAEENPKEKVEHIIQDNDENNSNADQKKVSNECQEDNITLTKASQINNIATPIHIIHDFISENQKKQNMKEPETQNHQDNGLSVNESSLINTDQKEDSFMKTNNKEEEIIAQNANFDKPNECQKEEENIVQKENFINEDVNKQSNKDRFEEYISLENKRRENEKYERIYFSINKEERSKEEYEEAVEESILKTINAIGKKYNMFFLDFYDAVYNDSIPKFVMRYLKLDTIKNVHLTNTYEPIYQRDKLNKQEIKNIEAVISFLREKKEIFSFLVYDFYTPSNIKESTIFFYINFLDNFFLKTSKVELGKRCFRITSLIPEFRESKGVSFYIPEAHYCLLHFFITGSIHNFSFKKCWRIPYFSLSKVPLICKSYLYFEADDESKYSFFPPSIYYQLQFIYDAIDTYGIAHHIVEMFYQSINKIREVKLPDINKITQKFKIRNYSMKYKTENSVENNQDSINKEEIDENISFLTFKDRLQEINHSDDEVNNQMKSSKEIPSFEQFWNSKKSMYKYENGLFHLNDKSTENLKSDELKWENELTQILHDTKDSSEQGVLFTYCQCKKIYKIFYYDEIIGEWRFDSSEFNSFKIDKKIDVSGSRTPLIFFLNTPDDIVDLMTQNIFKSNPDFEDCNDAEQIFIDAKCDKSLLQFTFISFTAAEKGNKCEYYDIKPIFLQLHVPKSKKNLPNINRIMINMYAFLSICCDLGIVVLNKTRYMEQIEFTKTFFKIINIKKDEKVKQESKLLSFSSSDNEEYDMEEEKWENINYNSINIEDIEKSNFKRKDPKIIFLIDDKYSQDHKSYDIIQKKMAKSQFFKNLLSNDTFECPFAYIETNRLYSYANLVNFMKDRFIKNCNIIDDLDQNLNCIRYSQISESYINLKLKGPSWREELNQIIRQRYNMIKLSENQTKKESWFNLLSKLTDEISKISPFYDDEFNNECSLIISDIQKEKCKKEQSMLKAELKISSDQHLKFIEKTMKKKDFWNEEQMLEIKLTHERFLHEEFYSIIKLTCPENTYSIIYEENIDVLNHQKNSDDDQIKKIFEKYVEINKIKSNTKEESLQEDINKGTNYSVRETENLREIKVTVQINRDLKSEIEQDF